MGLVRSRLRAHLLLPVAAMSTMLLATAVLTSLTAFASAVGDTGVRHQLERQAASRAVVDVHSTVTAGDRENVDHSVRQTLRGVFGGLPTEVAAATRSSSYALPGPPDEQAGGATNPDLTLFTSLDPHRVRITDGQWPARGASPTDGDAVRVPVAVPELVADRLGLRVGDALRLESRLKGPPPVRAEITGVYVPEDRTDPYWRLDPLGGDGVRTLSYTTYGPLAVLDRAFVEDGLAPAETYWQADADFRTLDADDVAALRGRVAEAVEGFAGTSGVGSAVANTELPEVLAGLERSLLVSSSTLLVAGLPLAALAALTLLLVAQLLAAERAAETALLRARGSSRARIAVPAGAEGLLLALPGLALAPLIAMPVVRALTAGSTLAPGGADAGRTLPAEAWWVAAGTSLACALTVALPAYLRSAELSLAPSRRRAAALLRGGVDVALLAVAGIAVWQLKLRSFRAGVLTGPGPAAGGTDPGAVDGLGIDPVLVTATALALLATTVPALRALPLITRLAERRAARGRGLTTALAGWQLGRRPHRAAGPAVLVVLAVAMGVFSVGQGASWDRSQSDQAAFAVGADVAVTGSSAPAFGQGGLLEDTAGVTAVAPVARDFFGVGGDADAQVVLTDTRTAGRLLHLRDDLADEPLRSLLAPLAATDAAAGGITLPQDTRELRFPLRLQSEGGSGEDEPSVTVTVEDRFGVPYLFELGRLPGDGRRHTLTARIAEEAGGADGAPTGPLRLTRITVGHIASTQTTRQQLTLEQLLAVDADGRAHAVQQAGEGKWSTTLHATEAQENLGLGEHDEPRLRSVQAGTGERGQDLLTASYSTGSVAYPPSMQYPAVPVDLTVEPAVAPDDDGPLPAVATDAFLRATGAKVGDTVQAQISGHDLSVRVTGALRALPTTGTTAASADAAAEGGPDLGPDGGALLLDLAAVDARLAAAGTEPVEPEGWWLTHPGESERVAAALRAHPSIDTVVARTELAAQLRGDPLGAGPRTALTAVAIAAAVLAATGFAMSTAGAARERRGEFAVLRALGAPRARLARVLAAEQGTLVLLSSAVGLVLGILLTRLVVPLIVLTAGAATPVPPLVVHLPVARLALLVGTIVAVPLLVISATALRGAAPATTLRTERGD